MANSQHLWLLGSVVARNNCGRHHINICSIGLRLELCVVALNDLVHGGAHESILPVVMKLDHVLQQVRPSAAGEALITGSSSSRCSGGGVKAP